MIKCPNFLVFPKKIDKKYLFFILILIFATFLRFWNIAGSLQFLGDQGRDSLIVSKIFLDKDLVFIGPVTSVGNMYLGPLYYYFMVPFLMLTYPSPMGPVYAVAFLGVLTIYFMYILGKKLVGEKAALIGAFLMAFSSVVVAGTRFSWNPNPAPLVSLLMIYFIFKALRKNVKYWILVVLCFSILIQLHYFTLLSGFSFAVLWLWQLYEKLKYKKPIKNLIISTMIGVVIFFIFLTPLILFDIKHNGLNFKAFQNMFTGEKSFTQKSSTLIGKTSEYLLEVRSTSKHILFNIAVGDKKNINNYLLLIAFTILFLNLKNVKKKDDIFYGKVIILTFLITGILGASFYKHTIFDHYIAYLFPISFLTLGIIGEHLYDSCNIKMRKKIIPLGKITTIFFMIIYINYNIPSMREVLKSVSWTMEDVWRTSKTISDRVKENEKYNIVLLTGTGDIDGQNYRYFLSTTKKPPVKLEDRDKSDTLFIINDDKVLKKVTDSPIYEIVVFPNKNPIEVYEIDNGPEITILKRE